MIHSACWLCAWYQHHHMQSNCDFTCALSCWLRMTCCWSVSDPYCSLWHAVSGVALLQQLGNGSYRPSPTACCIFQPDRLLHTMSWRCSEGAAAQPWLAQRMQHCPAMISPLCGHLWQNVCRWSGRLGGRRSGWRRTQSVQCLSSPSGYDLHGPSRYVICVATLKSWIAKLSL